MSADNNNPIDNSRFNSAFHDDRVMDSMLHKMLQSETDQEQFLDNCMARIAELDNDEELRILGEQVPVDEHLLNRKNQAEAIQLMGIAALMLVGCFMYSMFIALETPERQIISKREYAANSILEAYSREFESTSIASSTSDEPAINTDLNESMLNNPSESDDLESAIADIGNNDILYDLVKPVDPKEKISLDEVQQLLRDDLIPNRYLNIKLHFKGNGRAQLSLNNIILNRNLEPYEARSALARYVPELTRRMSFLGPRLGRVFGHLTLDSKELSLVKHFDSIDGFKTATGAINESLDRMKTNGDVVTARSSIALAELVESTNNLFQGWAQDAIQAGFSDTPMHRDRAEKFARIIDPTEFQMFANSGNFYVNPAELYMPESTIQHIGTTALKQQLAKHTEELSLFENAGEFEAFKAQHLAPPTETDPLKIDFSDQPIESLVKGRVDLEGLPLVMGRDCHLNDERADSMDTVSRELGPTMSLAVATGANNPGIERTKFHTLSNRLPYYSGDKQKMLTLDQMVQHESPTLKYDFIAKLGSERSKVNSNLLTCYAKFDLDEGVRMAATRALANYDSNLYRKKLLEGFSYPWEVVAQHAAEALVRLNDTSAVPQLVELLRATSPTTPYQDDDGNYVRKQLVAVNHMKNCMLCHAVSYSSKDRGRALVPEWNRPIPPMYYGAERSRGLVARADITYLRQDFSVVQPVEEHKHWPKNQRFDYLVKETPVSQDQVNFHDPAKQVYRDAIIFALQKLTDQKPEYNDYDTWKRIARELKSTTP